jgi:hypothetical protein
VFLILILLQKRVRATELETEVATAKKKKEDLKQKLQTLEASRETTVPSPLSKNK